MIDKICNRLQECLYAEGALLVLQLEYPAPGIIHGRINLALQSLYLEVFVLRLVLSILPIRRTNARSHSK
jgi:hypothetical protein